jgi:hypothetical protein
MSIHRNRAKLNKAITDKEALIIERVSESYCLICNKRSGTHHWDCSPSNIQAKHRHGSGKAIYPHKWRSYKSWKHNRKTQYKNETKTVTTL